jgi:plastocyanin
MKKLVSVPMPSVFLFVISIMLTFSSCLNYYFAYAELYDEPPNIKASDVYNTHTMILGKNIKNFVILIPNEAHESINQIKKERPLINQPYIPQYVIADVGTTIGWFNADKGHNHAITINDSNSGAIAFKSQPVKFSESILLPSSFYETNFLNYFEKNVNSNDPKFVMNGTITMLKQSQLVYPNNLALDPSLKKVNVDTVGSMIVPFRYLTNYTTELTKSGFIIDSTFTYNDLRGGQKGTGPEQTLLVWATFEIELDEVISSLKKITSTLPYN